jgi:hypothetical protein
MLAPIVFALFIVLLGLDLGAGLYETRVLVPRWEAAPAANVAPTDPVFAIARDAGMLWWRVVTPATGLCALLALVATLMTPGADRIWRAASSGLEVLVVLTTLTHFAPNIIRLLDPARTMPGPEAAARLRTWMAFNWARVCSRPRRG